MQHGGGVHKQRWGSENMHAYKNMHMAPFKKSENAVLRLRLTLVIMEWFIKR
jgi:hypothetical protein